MLEKIPKRSVRLAATSAALGALLLLAWMLYAPRPAHACKSLYLTFKDAYTPVVPNLNGSRIDNCYICHVGPNGGYDFLNRYGLAVHNLKPAAVPFCDETSTQSEPNRPLPADADDSDGDGWSNLKEIMALSFPGFPFDQPRAGDISSTSTLLGNQADPDPTNNAATSVVTISP